MLQIQMLYCYVPLAENRLAIAKEMEVRIAYLYNDSKKKLSGSGDLMPGHEGNTLSVHEGFILCANELRAGLMERYCFLEKKACSHAAGWRVAMFSTSPRHHQLCTAHDCH